MDTNPEEPMSGVAGKFLGQQLEPKKARFMWVSLGRRKVWGALDLRAHIHLGNIDVSLCLNVINLSGRAVGDILILPRGGTFPTSETNFGVVLVVVVVAEVKVDVVVVGDSVVVSSLLSLVVGSVSDGVSSTMVLNGG